MPTYAAPFSPSAELTAVGIAKESAFGSYVAPTVWMICDQADFIPTTELLDRPGARQRIGRTSAVPGMFTGKGTLSCEADPDNVEAALMFSLGLDALADSGFGTTNAPNFQAAISNPSSNGSVNTQVAAPGAQAGNANFPVSSATGISAGTLLTIGSGGNAETVQVLAVSGTMVATELLKKHAIGATVASATVTNAHLRALQLQSPRPSFSATVFRVTDLIHYVGCKVSSLSIAANEKQILTTKLGLEYQTEASVGGYSTYDPTPTWPNPPSVSFSTLQPFTFEAAGNYGYIDGVQSSAAIMGWQVDLNTGLVADYPNFGSGRLRSFYPEQQSKVSGSLNLGFETQDVMRKFWGNALAQGPQPILARLVLTLNFTQPWYINQSYQYQMTIVLAAVKISSVGIPIKNQDYLKQAVKFEAYESSSGASDDMLIFLWNQNGSASNTGGF